MSDHNISKKMHEIPKAKTSYLWEMHKKNGYNLNKEGFRSDSFQERKEINVASIGCSNTLGWGVEVSERFSTLFCIDLAHKQQKTVADWNFGLGGKSNDYIARTVLTCENTLNPDIYLICFTGMGRREYWDHTDKCIDYVPANYPEVVKQHCPKDLHLHKKLHLLQSDSDNVNNFIRNFHTVKSVLQNKPWCFCFSSGREHGGAPEGNIENIVPQEKYVAYFQSLDYANDYMHPGPISHQLLANLFIEKLFP
jgi:hypothetical protein